MTEEIILTLKSLNFTEEAIAYIKKNITENKFILHSEWRTLREV
jgi:hypothetical protein